MQRAAAARLEWAAAGLLLLGVTAAVRAIWLGDPAVDHDEQLYSLIGSAMLDGQWPYVDLWDRKPFGLFAIFAAAHALLGPGAQAYQLVAGLFAFASAALTYAIARRLSNIPTALAASVLAIVLLAAYGARSGQAEIFFLPLMLGMVWLLRDVESRQLAHRAQLAMLLGGVALQVKYSVLPQCLVLGFYALYWLWRQDRRGAAVLGHAVSFATLGLLPTALVFGGYILAGHGDAWLFANLESFFLREGSGEGRISLRVLAMGSACFVLLAGGYYAAVRFVGPDHTQTYRLVLVWALSCLASVFLPATIYYYYFAALVPAAVLVAVPLLDTRGPGKWVPALAAPLIALAFLDPLWLHEQSQQRREAIARLSQAIDPLVGEEGRCLFVFDGPSALYRLSGSCLPTPLVYPDHLNNRMELRALPLDPVSETGRILAQRPPVIVTADRPLGPPNRASEQAVRDAIAARYIPLARELVHDRIITAWRAR